MPEMTTAKIERSATLREQVYSWLQDKILGLAFSPGEPINETKLALQLGVSRTPVHQALSQLEQEGFVFTDSHGDRWVAEISLREVEEIVDLRELLEIHLLREVVGRFTQEELAEMESVLNTAEKLLPQDTTMAYRKANRAFHHFFDRKYANRRISAILENLDNHLLRIFAMENRREPGQPAHSLHEHRVIFEACKKGDVELAVSVMRKHLRSNLLSDDGGGTEGVIASAVAVPRPSE